MKSRFILTSLASLLIALGSCTNNGQGDETRDTAQIKPVEDNTSVGDTSSYDRMPQKLTDSMP